MTLHACEIPDATAQFFADIMRDAGYEPAHKLVPGASPSPVPTTPAPADTSAVDARLRLLEDVIFMLSTPNNVTTMPDLPRNPTRPLTEPSGYPFESEERYEDGYAPSVPPSRRNTDELASSKRENQAESGTETGVGRSTESHTESEPKPEPLGRELVVEKLDAVIKGTMTPYEFLTWAEKAGGRKYSARAQAIKQIQQALQEGEQSTDSEQQ
jgi:hypothetical protein